MSSGFRRSLAAAQRAAEKVQPREDHRQHEDHLCVHTHETKRSLPTIGVINKGWCGPTIYRLVYYNYGHKCQPHSASCAQIAFIIYQAEDGEHRPEVFQVVLAIFDRPLLVDRPHCNFKKG